MARKCCVCGGIVAEGGYEVLGYKYHEQCFPFFETNEKQRCYYCHKIMRKGDKVVSLGDLGVGGNNDRVCVKCANKHFNSGRI